MYAEYKGYGTKHSPAHIKFVNRHSKIVVFVFHNRCILKNLGVRFSPKNESLKTH